MVAVNEAAKVHELERRIGITIEALEDVREHVRMAKQADNAEEIARPSPWPDRLIFLALAIGTGLLGAILYVGALLWVTN